ncbi:MAG: UvrD-helicase domain-containing protein [Gemmatimonadota bacterium]|nr:MAG: UvrD-helicase domain-containing protein [Gemmatimonadota bacterium]
MSGSRPAPSFPSGPLEDQEARDRIRADLDTNLLVEAGAGAGKTTALTHRMVALIRGGKARIEDIAAVTFTRKAAAELRERFQAELERELKDCAANSPEAKRLDQALRGIDRAFLGTIHAFCARLLRERPLEAGIDPGFAETPEAEMVRLRRRYWHGFLERLVAEGDPMLEELAAVGLRPDRLEVAFETATDNPDVRFAAEEGSEPDAASVDAVREALTELLDRGLGLMPEEEPSKGWDNLQSRLRALDYRRTVQDWTDRRLFLESLALLLRKRAYGITQIRWSETAAGKAEAVRFQDAVNAFIGDDSPARALHDQWLAYRYGIAVRFVARAARELAEHRQRSGRLDFQDLLLLAARLLRSSPQARRDLGSRYQRILVDEFQDTDPLQAEVLFLLASEPSPRADEESWRTAVPRPGSLFVVGDPKQSIYRFRRADIVVYDSVKDRFRRFGDVLQLVTNFRSRPAVAEFVNRTFGGPEGLFPKRATPQQAGFAPLITVPKELPAPREGVFWYPLEGGRNARDRARSEAGLLAEWVAGRIRDSERRAGDFLILTRNRANLDLYARALEEWNVPVDVSGARIGVEVELTELMALLRLLADPEDPVKTVSVLTGLFFGLDLEQLTEHRLSKGRFCCTDRREGRPGGTVEVNRALARLRGWWRQSIVLPADVLVGQLAAELGLLPFAATGPLGRIRAGAMGYALDAVRACALAGDASLVGALEALETAIAWEDAETPFEPGRSDLVRVMNIHRAKGLEAPVVVLTGAEEETTHPIALHVQRPPGGEALGHLVIREPEGWVHVDLARPLDWKRWEEEEREFDAAERNRLQYVAGTRAEEELVIGCRERGKPSPWSGYHAALSELATEISRAPGSPPVRQTLDMAPDEIGGAAEAARQARQASGLPTYRMESVTALAKGTPSPPFSSPSGEAEGPALPLPEASGTPIGPRGYEWGSVVHGALAAAARGVEGEALRLLCRSLLVEYELPVDEKGGPRHLEELLELIARVSRSDLWRRARSAEELYVETPFAGPYPAGSPVPTTVEGVVDLAFREPDGWVIADYKTDRGDDPAFESRSEAYRRQVEIYARCWEELTGEPVKERILLFTARGRSERW